MKDITSQQNLCIDETALVADDEQDLIHLADVVCVHGEQLRLELYCRKTETRSSNGKEY